MLLMANLLQYILPSIKYYTRLEKTKTISNWNKEWETHKNGWPLYHFLKKVDTNRLYSDFHINMMLTGHGYFPEDFNRFNTRKINCVCGKPKHLANNFHMINECEQFADLQRKLEISNNWETQLSVFKEFGQ